MKTSSKTPPRPTRSRIRPKKAAEAADAPPEPKPPLTRRALEALRERLKNKFH
jgi:hypothetical protein